MREEVAEYKLSLYKTLTVLKENAKTKVELVQCSKDSLIYIKKTLSYSKIEIYEILKKVRCDNLAKVYEVIDYKGKLIVIEEFINGKNLGDILEEKERLDEKEVITYAISLCKALSVIHSKENQIVHRDLKPSNIIVDMNGVLKLIDFDAARVYKVDVNRDTVILGTEGYISPEQLGYCQTDGRSDIYSFGVLLNVLLTGKMPREELYIGKLTNIIEKCIKLAPELRYDSADEICQALENINEIRETVEEVVEDIKINIDEPKIGSLSYEKQKKSDEFISNIKKLPGYRRGKAVNMLVGTFIYLFVVFGLFFSYEKGFEIKAFIENFAVVVFILMIVFLYSNFLNVQSKLPLLRSEDGAKRIVGKIIYFFIIFLITGLILELAKFF